MRRTRRWRAKVNFIAQCAIAAGVSYTLARYLFSVEIPLFAPVATILTLGMTYGQRFTRAAEVTLGVSIGALVGELFVLTVGMGVWQVVVLVALAMSIASWLGAGTLIVNQAGIQGLVIALLAGQTTTAFGRWYEALIGAATGLVFASFIPSSVLLRPRARASAVLERLTTLFISSATGIKQHDRKMVEESLAEARSTEDDLRALRGFAADSVEITTYTPWYRNRRPEMQEVVALLDPIDRAVRNSRVLLRRAAISVQVEEAVPDEYIELIWELAHVTEDFARFLATGERDESLEGVLWNLSERSARPAPGAELSAEVIRAQIRSILVDYYMMLGYSAREAQRTVHQAIVNDVERTEAAIEAALDEIARDEGPDTPGP
ncbi:MAG: FUSC family protein [Dermatophilus congolensis]|nr:FUSC family protein [Dermatophilus congolensis]